jgi:hypothetical protein
MKPLQNVTVGKRIKLSNSLKNLFIVLDLLVLQTSFCVGSLNALKG